MQASGLGKPDLPEHLLWGVNERIRGTQVPCTSLEGE